MQFEKKKITCTPSQNHRRATLPSVLLFSRESRAKTVPEQPPPVSRSLPGTQNLLNKQQFATQNYLTLFRALLPPLLPLFRRAADKCFFPPALSIFAIPRVELAAEVEKSVCLVGDGLDCSARSSNNCARYSRTDPIVTSSCWRIS